ncbi:hypothetical protein [Streptomyces smyrnaeus]|uniref:hypothetical protein n=1 Tax=Streptomyces smyrnaeus TaxID=1387713 RepID=UPI0033F49041
MRGTTPLVAGVVAVVALTLSGCAGEGDGKNPEAARKPGPDRSASRSPGPEKDSAPPGASSSAGASSAAGTSARPSAESSHSSSAGNGSARAAEASASSSPGRATGSGTADGERAPGAGAGPDSSERQHGGGGRAAGVQGTWYFPYLVKGRAITFTVNGGSYTFSGSGVSCTGTIDRDLRLGGSCRGRTLTGRAVVSEGGRKLTLNWDNGKPDQFTRAQPR